MGGGAVPSQRPGATFNQLIGLAPLSTSCSGAGGDLGGRAEEEYDGQDGGAGGHGALAYAAVAAGAADGAEGGTDGR